MTSFSQLMKTVDLFLAFYHNSCPHQTRHKFLFFYLFLMCTLFFALDTHPIYDFILIGNRDEFLNRPTLGATWWDTHPNLFAGKDIQAGGTWMGVSKLGKIAALTNYRDPKNLRANAKSRGDLVKDFLVSAISPSDFIAAHEAEAHLYNDFNLVIGDRNELCYFSNKQKEISLPLQKGYYGLSNGLLDTPWPKVSENKQLFQELVENNEVFPLEQAFQLLQNTKTYPEEILPSTGIPLDLERNLSALFIKMPNYGTRVSTIILRKKTGRMYMEERSYYTDNQLKINTPTIAKTEFMCYTQNG